MDLIQIGETAGRIWQHLSKGGATALKDLPKAVGVDRDLALLGLGWLSREGKVKVEKKAKEVLVSLTEQELKAFRP